MLCDDLGASGAPTAEGGRGGGLRKGEIPSSLLICILSFYKIVFLNTFFFPHKNV